MKNNSKKLSFLSINQSITEEFKRRPKIDG